MLPELSQDEYLVWYGMPRQGIFLEWADTLAIPFSVEWAGGAIIWEYLAIFRIPYGDTGNWSLLMPLFGLPFVSFGLYMLVGRFMHHAKRRAQTYYGVTNQCVIIITELFKRMGKSLVLRTLSDMFLEEKADKSDTIVFGLITSRQRSRKRPILLSRKRYMI